MPLNGRPCCRSNHWRISSQQEKPSATANDPRGTCTRRLTDDSGSNVTPSSVISIRSTCVMIPSASSFCLLRYGLSDHVRRLIRSPVFGIRFGVGLTVCVFSPRSTSPANCGLNIRTKEDEQVAAGQPLPTSLLAEFRGFVGCFFVGIVLGG